MPTYLFTDYYLASYLVKKQKIFYIKVKMALFSYDFRIQSLVE